MYEPTGFEILEGLSALPAREVYSVARLNQEARALLEGNFPLIWVEGEISNFSRPSSGHVYFSLKDSQAQVRCAMFRTRNVRLNFTPDNGMRVLVRARVSLYEGRGEFQLIVEHMEEAGDGALRRAFEELKQRLAAQGLFDSARKKPLPALPRRIGVITSPTGAALRDILACLRRRFPSIPVLIYPVPVQGAGAAEKIAQTLRLAARRAECDVLILARGGGSLEDLWAFNEECVARALYECSAPVVTGIGHEIDFTIADLAADRRAATPTAAAELVSPDRNAWQTVLARLRSRLAQLMQNALQQRRQALTWTKRRLQHPGQRLRNQAQRLDELEQRLARAQRALLHHTRSRLAALRAQLQRLTPLHRVQRLHVEHENLSRRLRGAVLRTLERAHSRLDGLARALDGVSPLATLGRGYAILQRLPERSVVRAARGLAAGDRVEARLGQGGVLLKVEKRLDE
ncbi:MAG: exodeoxyribonuclease VII large subunit [Pseudomonadota bacterium]